MLIMLKIRSVQLVKLTKKIKIQYNIEIVCWDNIYIKK